MKKKSLSLLIAGIAVSGTVFAATPNLITVYRAALKSDPQFQQALANRDIAQQDLPLQVAALLPQINLAGLGEYEKENVDSTNVINPVTGLPASSNVTNKNKTLGFTATLNQSIFNFTNWMNVASAKNSVKAAYATYTAAAQDLIQRTAKDYFAVLLAEEQLKYTEAEKRAFYRKYIQAKESYQVGVKTITDVYNAKASYDTSVAEYVTAKNNVKDALEDLRTITGVLYTSLAGIKTLPLVNPKPANIQSWAKTAENHNWDLLAARYSLLSSHDSIKAAFGGHLPSLAFQGTFSNNFVKNINAPGKARTKTLTAALNLTIPVYSGGMVTAQVKQAIANYDLSAGKMQQTYRDTINNTRQAYLGAISGISKIRADEQAVISNRSSVKGMEEGYRVGTQTMTDVLIAEKNLYDALSTFANDRNAYIMSLIDLKQAAGTLSVDDIVKLNRYLVHTNNIKRFKKTEKRVSRKPKARHHKEPTQKTRKNKRTHKH